MSLTLQEIRDLVRRALGDLTSADMPDSEVDQYINMAIWSLEDQYDFKAKECFVESDTADGQARYTVPSDLDAIMGVNIRKDQQWTRLDRTTEDWYYDNYDEDSDATGVPERYWRRDTTLILHPTPDDVYRIGLMEWRQLNSLANSGDIPELPRNWHEIIVDEAIVKGLKYNGDINQAQQFANFPVQQRRQAVLGKNKEEEDSEQAGLNVRSEGRTNWR